MGGYLTLTMRGGESCVWHVEKGRDMIPQEPGAFAGTPSCGAMVLSCYHVQWTVSACCRACLSMPGIIWR